MNMKSYIPFLMVAGLIAFGACKEKKESTDIITTKYVPKKLQAPIAMPVDTKTTHITWQDKPYTVQIDRVSDDSLKHVKDEYGQPYIDNRVSVTILRQDGSVFFKKEFTKASFSSYIDDTFRNNGILAGIQYDEIDDNGLEFSVVVGMPDALDDVFIPLELVIDRQGAVSISRDDDMDMLDYDDREGNFDDEGV
jgi:hypothetical protein